MPTLITSTTKVGGDTVTSANNNAQRLDILQMGGDYATATGSANAYVLTLDSAITALTTGAKYKFKANFAPTGACTVNINGLGSKTIKKRGDVDLVDGDIKNGQIVELLYDGTYMQYQGHTLANDLASQAEAEAGTSNVVIMTSLRTKQQIDARLASQAEAEAGTSNVVIMTSLRTKQQIDARLASQAEAEAGTNNTTLMTPLRVKQAINAMVHNTGSSGSFNKTQANGIGTYTMDIAIGTSNVTMFELMFSLNAQMTAPSARYAAIVGIIKGKIGGNKITFYSSQEDTTSGFLTTLVLKIGQNSASTAFPTTTAQDGANGIRISITNISVDSTNLRVTFVIDDGGYTDATTWRCEAVIRGVDTIY